MEGYTGFDINCTRVNDWGKTSQPCPACGHWATLKESQSAKNPGRKYWQCPKADAKFAPNAKGCGFFLWQDEPHKLDESIRRAGGQGAAKRQRTDEVAAIAGPPLPDDFQKEWTELRGKVEANNAILETILEYVMQIAQ
ncbi:MAG: hypothetical protein ACPGR8_06270 [Limisphaerales bacterium]